MLVALFLGGTPTQARADACPAGGEHDYEAELIVPSTDDSDGLQRFTCIKCGDTFEQTIPATGHIWGPWEMVVAPLCGHYGIEKRTCETDASHVEERIIPQLSPDGSHAWVEVRRHEATCESMGQVIYSCSRCGSEHVEELAPLGHAWGAWETVRAAEPGREGLERRVCAHDASHVEERAVAALAQPVEEAEAEAAPEKREEIVVETREESGTRGVAPEPGPAPAPEPPAEENAVGLWVPNALDVVLVGVDAIAVAALILVVGPLVFARRWILRKRIEAKRKMREKS